MSPKEQENSEIKKQKKEDESIEKNLDKYSSDKSKSVIPSSEISEQAQKELEKTKKELNKIKSFIVKKYPFVQSIGILPPKAIPRFLEEELEEKDMKDTEQIAKKVHLYVILPEEKLKEIPKIKQTIIEEIRKEKQEIWVHIKTIVDVWETGLDSKFELLDAIGMSFPLYDKGILQVLKVAVIHKSLVLQKFEKYVVSYVAAGSIIRGDALKTSDADIFIIIDDTDVKRMPRLELKERLRGMIHQYIAEAHAIAGAKENLLHVQVYLLTDFWESVKDAHPVIFTFIRDGIPLYDRGTFMPWKALLRMGKLKPSPEAIDMFMSMGDKTVKRAKGALMEILVQDIFWSIVTPSQALLMLYGQAPPTPKYLVQEMKAAFIDKEKMLEKKYLDILDRVIKAYKDFEHERIKEMKGAKIDKFIENTEEYLKRLAELRKQIEKKAEEKTLRETYDTVFKLLNSITKRKSQSSAIAEFEKMVCDGKFTPQHTKVIKNILAVKNDFKKGKSDLNKIDKVRRDSTNLINDLMEYSQRKELIPLEKGRMKIRYGEPGKEKTAELAVFDGKVFLFKQNKILKVTNKVEESNQEEFSKTLEKQKCRAEVNISSEALDLLKKEFKNFEIVF